MYPALLRYFYQQRYTANEHGTEAVKIAAIAKSHRGFSVLNKTLKGRD